MSTTLFELAKLGNLDPASTAAQYAIAQSGMVFNFLPFFDKDDFQFDETYDTEAARSSFRALNEELSEGEQDVAKLQYSIGTFGDKATIDRKILQAKGNRGWNNKKLQKSFGVGATFNENFIKGDQLSNAREFNGLQSIMENQMPASQTLSGGSSGGDALSLALLDEAIQAVRNAGIMVCSKAMARRFWAAGRDSSVAGFVNYQPNDANPIGAGLGAAITFYNGIPIVPLFDTFNADTILPFDEIAPGGGSAVTSSIYIAKLGQDGLYGAQMGGVEAHDYGQLDNSVMHAWDVEWSAGVGVAHPLSVCRFAGITDAPFVV